jgi:hypothetical protein
MLLWNQFAARAFAMSRLVTSGLLLTAALAPSAAAQTYHLNTFLSGNQAVPPIFTNAQGHGCFVLDASANTLSYYVSTTGTGTPTAAHIHGFAAPGVEAPVLFNLGASYPLVGSVNLTPAQTAGVLSGLAYIDIHTFGSSEEEIRGQILAVAPPTQTCFGDGSVAACPCGNESPAGTGGCLNSLGLAGRLEASGFASGQCDSFSLTGSNMLSSTTIYFQGWSIPPVAPAVFGDGLRCAGGDLQRLAVVTNVGGTSQVPLPGGPSISTLGHVNPSGTPYVYQAYYRDPDPTHCPAGTFNVTNAVTVQWVP